MSFSRVEQLSERTFLVVENDPYGQYPFLYVIVAEDKCILIDSGCGTADYRDFVTSRINKKNLPYLVINTHVHFDHVGGNHCFCGSRKSGCIDICMGCRDKKFTQNYEINSLALAHNGMKVKDFSVSRWLNEGDLIYLDDKNPTKEGALEVIFTPGHTSDSISLYAHWEKRLFVGDTIYPFTAIHLDGIGSNVVEYLSSVKKLSQFASAHMATQKTSSGSVQTVNSDPQKQEKIQEFFSFVGLDAESAAVTFNVESLLELCDWNLESGVDFYLNNSSEISSVCPPNAIQIQSSIQTTPNNDIHLSCGHVEANLGVGSLEEMTTMLEVVRAGALQPQHVDGDYGEFSNGTFTVMMPLKVKWEN